MKKLAIICLTVLALAGTAAAVNVSSLDVSPSDRLWTDQQFEISAVCEPTANNYTVSIVNISADVQGQNSDYTVPTDGVSDLVFFEDPDVNGRYQLNGSEVRSYVNSIGSYQPGLYIFYTRCEEQGGAAAARNTSFVVRDLEAAVVNEAKDVLYPADPIEMRLRLKELDGGSPRPITDAGAVNLTATLDGTFHDVADVNLGKEWGVPLNAPTDPGSYDLTITAHYDGASASVTRDIVVKERLQFELSTGRTLVAGGDTLQVGIEKAVYEGTAFSVDAQDITVTLDGSQVPHNVSDGTILVELPEKNPGTYELSVTLRNAGGQEVQTTRTFDVVYPVTVRGAFTEPDDTPIRHSLTLSGADVSYTTSGRGSYSLSVAPETYELTASFPDDDSRLEATATLTDVPIKEDMSGLMRYQQYEALDRMSGMRLGGLYYVETGVSFDTASLTLGYTDRYVQNPDRFSVYRCTDWNVAQATCYGEWRVVPADFDRVAGAVTVETSTLGAFAVGYREPLDLQYSAETTTFTPDETVTVTGVVQDADGTPVGGANVSAAVAGTAIEQTAATSDDGLFTVSFPTPDAAGTHTVDLTASRPPYSTDTETLDITVNRPPHLSVVAPDSIRLTPNTTREVQVYLRNDGFRVLDDVRASVNASLPAEVQLDARPLAVNESRNASLIITAPPGAEPGTRRVDVTVAYAESRAAAATLGVTVEEPSFAARTPAGMVAGAASGITASAASVSSAATAVPATLPSFEGGVLLLILLQVGLVAFVVFRRNEEGVENRARHALEHVKQEVSGGGGSGQQPSAPVAPQASSGGDGPRRERVVRSMSAIKQELQRNN